MSVEVLHLPRIPQRYSSDKRPKKTQQTPTILPSIINNQKQSANESNVSKKTDAGINEYAKYRPVVNHVRRGKHYSTAETLLLKQKNDNKHLTEEHYLHDVVKTEENKQSNARNYERKRHDRNTEQRTSTDHYSPQYRRTKIIDQKTTNINENITSTAKQPRASLDIAESTGKQETLHKKTSPKMPMERQDINTPHKYTNKIHNSAESKDVSNSPRKYFITSYSTQQNDIKENKKAHANFIMSRSVTIHSTPAMKPEHTHQKARSKSAGRTGTQSKLPNTSKKQNLKAYNSVAKIPNYPISTKSNTASHNARNSSSAFISRNRKDTGQSQTSSKENVSLISMKELTNYKKTAAVYMNERWQKSRRERFYNRLEEMQIKRMRKRKQDLVKHQQKLQETKDEQTKQLSYIRDKHQSRRSSRLSTQHVKWKYVLGGMESDRKQYGLPSEYYTHYGFSEKDLENTKKLESKLTRKNESTNSERTTLLPTEQERTEIRKRNIERYDHIFGGRSKTQTDLMNSIFKKGLYTVDIEEDVQPRNVTSSTTENNQIVSKENLRGQPRPLVKRTSRLVVKNIVEEAKQILNTLDEQDSDSDSESV